MAEVDVDQLIQQELDYLEHAKMKKRIEEHNLRQKQLYEEEEREFLFQIELENFENQKESRQDKETNKFKGRKKKNKARKAKVNNEQTKNEDNKDEDKMRISQQNKQKEKQDRKEENQEALTTDEIDKLEKFRIQALERGESADVPEAMSPPW